MPKVSFYDTPFHVREDVLYLEDHLDITWNSEVIMFPTGKVINYFFTGIGPDGERIRYWVEYGVGIDRKDHLEIDGQEVARFKDWTVFHRTTSGIPKKLTSYEEDRLRDEGRLIDEETYFKSKLDWS